MERTSLVVSVTLMATVLTLTSAPAIAQVENAPTTEGAQTAASTPSAPPTGITQVPVGERDQVLGSGWRQSADLAWTVTGDAAGLRLLVSRAAQGYAWRSVATLSEPGFTVDSWIGNACLTSSSRYVAVTYAPRTFTNKPDLNQRGAFTAVVDLTSGAVKKLGVGSSLAYFSPSCGDADSVVFTQDGAEKLGKTRLLGVDAARGTVTSRVTVSGQVTSAVKTRNGLVAAIPGALVRVEADGALTALAPTSQTAFNVRVVGDGDVAYLDWAGSDASLHRLSAAQVRSGVRQKTAPPALAQGALTESGLARGVGNVAVTGSMKQLRPLGKGLQALPVPVGTEVSTTGALTWGAPMPSGAPSEALADPTIEARPIVIDTVARATAKPIRFVVTPESRRSTEELEPSPVLGGSAATSGKQAHPSASVAPLGSPTNPVENERTCSVARNDPNNQAMQPKPRQVEWAVNQAVRDVLTVQRPANWKNLGMPAYTPQGLFPPIPLVGGGKVPAQVYLGVLAQESNLWMAPGSVVPGVTGNPLIGNYYGLELYNSDPDDNWTIDWADADCGYGVSQTTDGMRLAGKERPGDVPALPYQTQRAVALDFAANVASDLRILQAKWNQTRSAGLIINDGDSSKIENWFYAVWAYNSGFHPQSGAAANNGAWGVGWSNNPANPNYPPNRLPFLDNGYGDAKNPQFWPYPEKVMGWAAYPVEVLESPGTLVSGYRQAWWNGDGANSQVNRSNVKPPVNQFCDVTNNCYPGTSNVGPIGNAGPCAHRDYGGQLDMKCWYNQPSTWKHDCSYSCGNEFIRFVPGYAYQEDGTAYPPNCTLSGLPAGALIIDDQPSTYQSVRPGCTRPHTNQGNFQFTFNSDANGMYPGKIDLWQLGAGFNGHFYYTHTRTAELRGNSMKTVGTWTLNRQLNQWARVFVHIPDHGAHTQQAVYTINLGNGTRTRVMLQRIRANRWVSLGVFPFSGTPKVSLSSVTADGDDGIRPVENEDIAWDAVAFQPLAAKPEAIVVSLGDSYSSGEGASAPGGVD